VPAIIPRSRNIVFTRLTAAATPALLTSVLAFILAFILVTGASAQVTAIKAGKLVDTESGATATNQVILVNGGKIQAVGSDVAIPPGATVIDLSKATVLPGLFDAHTHLCLTIERRLDNGNYFFTTLLHPDTYRAIEGVANARDMLAAGFTTVRDVGNAGNYADTSLREAIENGLIPGPTMLNAGRIITPFGGQFHLQPRCRSWL